ncbi:MAG: HD domain-containing protein [Bacilli bacterium]|jgi:3'-5' exoribonuclease|nr:HD domain-containing protein [Bacilli bacterium]
MFINEFEEHSKIKGTYLISNVIRGKASNGADYLSLKLQDKTGQIDAKMWQVSPEQLQLFVNGVFVNVSGDIISYKDNLQLKISDIVIIDSANIDYDNFVKSAPQAIAELRNELQEYIYEIDDQKINFIITKLVKEYDDKLNYYPAASRIHHAYKSGLLFHIVSMLRIGKALVNLYEQINKNYLYAGIILHDFGKMDELSGLIATEYTKRGRLVGHISIIHAKLLAIAKELGIEDSEQVLILEHIVLAHHGKLEFGSPVLPLTLEAEMLTYIDNIDAKYNTISEILNNIEPGQFTNRIYNLENRAFYKPKQ